MKKGKCRHKQLQSSPHAPTRLYPFLPPPFAHAQTTVDDAAVRSGAYLSRSLSHTSLLTRSHSLYKWRLSVFIVRRVTRQPADGGLPWPRWTGGGASFRNRRVARSLARLVTHGRTGRVHHTISAEVYCCVCVCEAGKFLCIAMRCLLNPGKPQSALTCSWGIFFFLQVECKLLKNAQSIIVDVGTQMFVLQPVHLFLLLAPLLDIYWFVFKASAVKICCCEEY